jgi:hypothetical protein
MGSPKIKILVACHKADPAIRQGGVYMPIQVGKALHPEVDLGFQCDNTGDNISAKNGSYCELTALYWAWKNLKDYDYIGLCHYRRYFDLDLTDAEKVSNIFKKHDIIIVNECIHNHCAADELNTLITQEDVALMLNTILLDYPQYRKEVVDYFYNNNKYSIYNMFVASRDTFNEYCEFFFPLLSKIEARLKPYPYSRLQRNIGYMAEAMLGLWIRIRQFKVMRVNAQLGAEKPHKIKLQKLRHYHYLWVKRAIWKRVHTHDFTDIPLYGAVKNALLQDGIELNGIYPKEK